MRQPTRKLVGTRYDLNAMFTCQMPLIFSTGKSVVCGAPLKCTAWLSMTRCFIVCGIKNRRTLVVAIIASATPLWNTWSRASLAEQSYWRLYLQQRHQQDAPTGNGDPSDSKPVE